MVRLIVGLGNPGREYEKTRHNVGFMVLDKVADSLGVSISREKFSALYGECRLDETKVFLVKPLTYMNRSGEAVAQFARFFKVEPSQILVIYDDLDLPLGKLRLRLRGSSAGHRGVQSIIDALSTQEFPRLRVGIGRPERKEEVINYVLSPFTEEEFKVLEPALERAAECAVQAARSGVSEKLISKCS
jgi:PTH1 family peptidyl-tRNA hydrolase